MGLRKSKSKRKEPAEEWVDIEEWVDVEEFVVYPYNWKDFPEIRLLKLNDYIGHVAYGPMNEELLESSPADPILFFWCEKIVGKTHKGYLVFHPDFTVRTEIQLGIEFTDVVSRDQAEKVVRQGLRELVALVEPREEVWVTERGNI
jgi:hypothetical protein